MKQFLKLFAILFFIYLLLYNSYEVVETIKFSFDICVNNLFPSLIPFMLITNILINYNFVESLNLTPITNLLKINKNCSFIIIMSILSGTPSNSLYIKGLLENNLISIDDAKKCLNFCHFTNPIFILTTIGYTFLNNKKLGLTILISHYLSSFIIGLFNKKEKKKNLIELKKDKYNKNFIQILKESINNTTSNLLLIMGIITTFSIIICLINNIFNINNNYKFIYGLLEVTNGLKYVALSSFSIKIKTILSSIFISFGGLCIHAQVFCILENKKIKYLPYFFSRLFHALLSALLTFIILNIIL